MVEFDCGKCTLKDNGRGPLRETRGLAEGPDIALIGDFPRPEEIKGKGPLRGQAGKILRQTMTELDFDLARVYYTLACLCGTKDSKDPTATTIKTCRPRLIEELQRVRPKLLVPMGNAATTAILGKGKGITKRRSLYEVVDLWGEEVGVIPTIHPAAVVKTPERYPDMVEDLTFIRTVLEGEPPIIEPPYENYVLVHDQCMFDKLLERLKALKEQGRVCVIDLETTGLNFLDGRILTIGFSWQRETGVCVDWLNLVENNLANFRKLKEVLDGLRSSMQGGQFDYLWLTHREIFPDWVFDTSLAHYCLDERQGYHGLKRLAVARYRAPQYGEGVLDVEKKAAKTLDQYLDDDQIHTAVRLEQWEDEEKRLQVLRYNGADVDYQYRLTEDLGAELADEGLLHVHDRLLLPAAKLFTALERDGMLVDVPYLEGRGEAWSQELRELEEQLRSFPGAKDINFRSPKQVSDYIYKELGLRQMGDGKIPEIDLDTLLEEISEIEDPEAQEYWKTQSSKASGKMKPDSTSTFMLYWLAQQHEWPRLMVKHRIAGRKFDAYYEGIRNAMWPDCRVRPRYRVDGTRTGRVSSGNPNIHGTPKLKEVKNIYMADPGYTIIAADQSQAEVRMMAHFANDRKLIASMREADIHTSIMKDLFQLSDEDVAKLPSGRKDFLRRAAKTIVFGIIYGRTAKGLAPQIGASVEAAEDYISAFFTMMPDVRNYIKRCHAKVMKEHFVETIFGNRRRFDLILSGGKASEVKRQAVNMPIQGSVSHMTLSAYVRIMDRLEREGIPAKPWPHKHDEVMIQVINHLVEPATEIVIEEMSDTGFETDVHFAVEVKTGRKWGDLQTVYAG